MPSTQKGIQKTTRNKFKAIAHAKGLAHGALMNKVQDHMMSCADEDCDICDMGQSGSMIDDDDVGEKPTHNKGTRSSSSKNPTGNIHSVGKAAQLLSRRG